MFRKGAAAFGRPAATGLARASASMLSMTPVVADSGAQRGFLGKILDGLRREFPGITEVGRDDKGNVFSIYSFRDGREPRRHCEYADSVPDPNAVHMLWSAWLRNKKPTPPTPAEIALFDARQQQLAVRVRKLQEADDAMRKEEQAIKLREFQAGIPAAARPMAMMTPDEMRQQIEQSRAADPVAAAAGAGVNTARQPELEELIERAKIEKFLHPMGDSAYSDGQTKREQ